MRVGILILTMLLTDDGDGRVHPMLGGSVWYVPSFSPESAAFRQDVVPFKIPDKVLLNTVMSLVTVLPNRLEDNEEQLL